MKSIGIDIGTSSIKVVEALSTNKGLQLLSFQEYFFGQNPAHDQELEIIEVLQGIARQNEGTPTKIVMGLRQDMVSVRHKIFPFADRLKIVKSLPFELEEDLPFSAETAVYEARVTRLLGNQAEVLACAVPRHRIAEYLERFQSTGLSISVLSAEGLAFANCFERWWDPIAQAGPRDLNPEDGPVRELRLVIQMGHSHTVVAAFEGEHLVGVRSILWGGKNIAEAISRKYELPYVEALKEMRTKAFILPSKEGASYDQIVFSDTIQHQVRELGQELKLSLYELETELNGKVTTAEITGGLAGVLHLGPALTQVLEVPVNGSSILSNFHTHFEKTAAIENSIGTALGLAIEGLRKPRNPSLQFLKGDFAPQNESLQILWATWSRTIQVTAAAFVIFVIYSYLREMIAAEVVVRADDVVKAQASAVAKLPKKQANANGIRNYIKEKRKRAQEMKSLEGLSQMNSGLDVLRRLSEASPGRSNINFVIHSFKLEDQNLTVEGTIGNDRDRATLQSALNGLTRDGKVKVSTGQAVPGALGLPISINMTIDRNISR